MMTRMVSGATRLSGDRRFHQSEKDNVVCGAHSPDMWCLMFDPLLLIAFPHMLPKYHSSSFFFLDNCL